MEHQSSGRLLTYLVLGTGIGFLLIALLCAGAIGLQNQLINDYVQVIKRDVRHQELIGNTNLLFKIQVQEWKNVLIRGKDANDREKYWGAFQRTEAEVRQQAEALLDDLPAGPAKTKVRAFLDAHNSMARAYRKGYETFVASGFDHTAGDEAVAGIDREPATLLQESIDIISGDTAAFVKQTADKTDSISYGLLPLVYFVMLLVAASVTFVISRHVARPLRELISVIRRFASGDFRSDINVNAKGEIGSLAGDIRTMQSNLVAMIKDLEAGATKMDAAAQEFYSITQTMLQQSESVQQRTDLVATATNEMSSSALEVARNASSARDAAESVDANARESSAVMGRTVASINRLAAEVQQVAEVMENLSRDSVRIGGVLDVIKNIAEQTNLLALNAAIEAARAGEQGRGFAVVADEVRTLAQRTQQSTEEIHQMISSIQEGTENAVQAMRKGQEQTKVTVDLSQEAGQAIEAITAAIEDIKGMNTQIATAAEEQSTVSEDINGNITNVALLAQQTHESAENSRQLGQQLKVLSGNIRSLTARFQT